VYWYSSYMSILEAGDMGCLGRKNNIIVISRRGKMSLVMPHTDRVLSGKLRHVKYALCASFVFEILAYL